MVHRDGEGFVQILVWRGGAETPHADARAAWSDIAVPSEDRGRFHRDTRAYGRGQHEVAIGPILFLEQFPARHADDAGFVPLLLQCFASLEAERNFAPRSHQDDIGLALAIAQYVGTPTQSARGA